MPDMFLGLAWPSWCHARVHQKGSWTNLLKTTSYFVCSCNSRSRDIFSEDRTFNLGPSHIPRVVLVLSEIPSLSKRWDTLNSQVHHPDLIKLIQNPHFGDIPHFQSHCSGLVHAPHKVLPKQEVEMELPIPEVRGRKSMDWLKGKSTGPPIFHGRVHCFRFRCSLQLIHGSILFRALQKLLGGFNLPEKH